FSYTNPSPTPLYTLSLHDALPIFATPSSFPDMKLSQRIYLGLLLGAALPVWSQVSNSPSQPVAAYGEGTGAENTDDRMVAPPPVDRKSTRLNSSHLGISYAVFCLK